MRFIRRPTLATTDDGAWVIQSEGLTRFACAELASGMVLIPVMLAALAYLVLGPWIFGRLIMGMVLQMGLGLMMLAILIRGCWETYPLLRCGVWRLDARGVTFHSEAGLNHQITWAEVERVFWTRRWIRLVGPRDQIRLLVYDSSDPAWQAVRARVEAALAPRFDLTIRTEPRGEFRLRRVVLPVIIVALAAWVFVRLAPLLTDRQFGELVLGLLMLSASFKLGLFFWIATVRANRLNPFWRTPRAGSARENGSDAKIV